MDKGIDIVHPVGHSLTTLPRSTSACLLIHDGHPLVFHALNEPKIHITRLCHRNHATEMSFELVPVLWRSGAICIVGAELCEVEELPHIRFAVPYDSARVADSVLEVSNKLLLSLNRFRVGKRFPDGL